MTNSLSENPSPQTSFTKATFAGGCFWCLEACFQKLNGVHSVISGFAGGTDENADYKTVCSGTTGHAEVIHITYDSEKISFQELLEVFWKTHDPTTLNQQGADIGTQYRSAVFYHDEDQRAIAELFKQTLDESAIFSLPIVTEIVPMSRFIAAEDHHQNYYEQNTNQPYCQTVILPKLEKFKAIFTEKLK